MNSSFGPSFIVFEFKSIAKGYSAVATATASSNVQIVEASAVNPGKFLFIGCGSLESCKKSFQSVNEKFKSEIIDAAIFENSAPEVLSTLYGQSKVTPEEALLFVETSNVASAFVTANKLVENSKLKLIEFKAARAIGGKSLIIATGSIRDCEAGAQKTTEKLAVKGSLVAAEVVVSRSVEFLKLFQL